MSSFFIGLGVVFFAAICILVLKAAKSQSLLICTLIMACVGVLWAYLLVYQNIANQTQIFYYSISKYVSGLEPWRFQFTPFAIVFTTTLIGISICVSIFSAKYMKEDMHKHRFAAYLLLFFVVMMGFILCRNLIGMFFFWEWVGLISWLFVGFWYFKDASDKASLKAFLFNKWSDAFLLGAILWIWMQYGTLDVEMLLQHHQVFGLSLSLCLMIGLIAKSAQFPLHTWLPDAMAGPTPASALIHAATMVAAGVWLLIQIAPLLHPISLDILWICALGTAAISGASALVQVDIKRIIAYSTISQLAWMMLVIAAGLPELAFFHLIVHAIFKSGLFLSAGAFIHILHHLRPTVHAQDIRNMHDMYLYAPLECLAFMLCAAGLAGVPFTAGFLSKELVLHAYSALPYWKFLSICFLAVLTIVYTARMCYFLLKDWNYTHWFAAVANVTFSNQSMFIFPVFILGFCSLWFFYGNNPFYGQSTWSFWQLTPVQDNHSSLIEYTLSIWALSLCGILYYIKNRHRTPQIVSKKISAMAFNHFGIDYGTSTLIPRMSLFLANKVHTIDANVFDKFVRFVGIVTVVCAHVIAWIDHALVDGVIRFIYLVLQSLGKQVQKAQSGRVQEYMFYAIGAVLFIVTVLYVLFVS